MRVRTGSTVLAGLVVLACGVLALSACTIGGQTGTSETTVAGSGTAAATSTSGAGQVAALTDEQQVRVVIQQLYGAMAARDRAGINRLLTGKAAGLGPEAWQPDVKLVGIDITTVKVAGGTAQVNVVERVEDAGGNTGVTAAAYELQKTPAGWKIASAEFGD
jgi:hypothetical protein